MTDDGSSRPLEFASWTSADEEAFIRELAASDPGIESLLAAHLEEEEGEVLSIMFLSDVVRWANERYAQGDQARVAGLLALAERHYERGDRYVRDLIGVGLVENMDPV